MIINDNVFHIQYIFFKMPVLKYSQNSAADIEREIWK